ncbi:cell wall hydrolase [Halanaerobium sp. MA284_MarDTE_T2]|uniref:cell wall hydrolase n=1 Tax=Halanaerobium sp. MA284_MarDTE_T2 TaxID=2183913 RepID=UPI000E173A1C|nr:cell wall hydrolase [Halanaerobium sp. MA284_MarDTE_T2]RCW50503.1 N-acetylmuramoyl-L-alanine amidase [Halanaerobium sp. MA284_MarDTE_T2]
MVLSKWKVYISVIMLLFMITLINPDKVEAAYIDEFGSRILRPGDEGTDVAILQKKLKKLNFYQGHIDGVYGGKTVAAVRKFQEANNIKADGIFRESCFNSLPRQELFDRNSISRDDVILLARVIHGEARGEDFLGKVAVGAVIMNRVKSSLFPDTIREVILQKGQFSSLMDGQANYYPGKEEVAAARAALIGYDPSLGSLYFYNPKVATNIGWISRRNYVKRIGEHVFLR